MTPQIIPISAYKSHFSKQKQKVVPGAIPYHTDFYTEMDNIKNGFYKSIIDELRSIEDKDEKSLFKCSKLPSITISSVCHTWRSSENIVNHTGLLNIDIDGKGNEHITDWQSVRDDIFKLPPVVACFLSAGGNGVTFVIKIEPEKHVDTFLSTVLDLKERMGIHCDTVVKDVVRLRFVSYDPDAKIRYNFDDIITVQPSTAYIAAIKENKPAVHIIASIANSEENFKNAVSHTETKTKFKEEYNFVDGEKYKFLTSIAGYCNTYGMDEDYCLLMVEKNYRKLTTIKDADLYKPIKDVYSKYKSQFGIKELDIGHPLLSEKQMEWLLSKISPDYLNKKLSLYGLKTIGCHQHIIQVSSILLVFIMSLACPEYTWTCTEKFNQQFTNEDCADVFKDGQLIDCCNNNIVFVKDGYPAEWDNV